MLLRWSAGPRARGQSPASRFEQQATCSSVRWTTGAVWAAWCPAWAAAWCAWTSAAAGCRMSTYRCGAAACLVRCAVRRAVTSGGCGVRWIAACLGRANVHSGWVKPWDRWILCPSTACQPAMHKSLPGNLECRQWQQQHAVLCCAVLCRAVQGTMVSSSTSAAQFGSRSYLPLDMSVHAACPSQARMRLDCCMPVICQVLQPRSRGSWSSDCSWR
jgi:hypothetical protein